MEDNEMKIYTVCFVSKEYRYAQIEANDEDEAREKAWDKVSTGFTCDTKAQDYDTELYVEGEAQDAASYT
jgi:hypothetical protein